MSIIISIIAPIFIFGLVIFIHELGHFSAAKHFDVKIHEFALGMGPALWKKQKGETTYALRALPIGGFVKMEGEDEASDDERSFSNKKPYQRFIILFAGAFMNIVLGFLIVVLMTSFYTSEIPTTYVDSVTAGMGAETAGVLPGDKIIKIDRNNVFTPIDFTLETMNKTEIQLTVLRNKEKINMTVALTQEDDGRLVLGIGRKQEQKNFFNVLSYSYFQSFSVIKLTYKSLFGMISGQISVNDAAGPVGIISEIGQAANRGLQDLLWIAMLISLNLGVMNLLPFPALDGGRIVFVLWEMITRKKPKPEIEGYIHFAGFAVLMLFILYVTKNDIVRLFTK